MNLPYLAQGSDIQIINIPATDIA